MARREGIKRTAEIMGLSVYELHKGVKEGKYPYFRVGDPKKGKIIFDLDLLEDRIKELMMSNVTEQENYIHFKPATGIRRVK